MTLRRSFSGLRVCVSFALASAAFLVAISLRFLGETAPVVAVPRGDPLPILGRVLACRCFLPRRFFCSRFFGAMVLSPARTAPLTIIGNGGLLAQAMWTMQVTECWAARVRPGRTHGRGPERKP